MSSKATPEKKMTIRNVCCSTKVRDSPQQNKNHVSFKDKVFELMDALIIKEIEVKKYQAIANKLSAENQQLKDHIESFYSETGVSSLKEA